jgi:putative tryptophan/tyrosine transport system substrate-binding protein
MKRREFITLLGGGAAAWPFAARAQQPDQIRRVGVLIPFPENSPFARAFVSAFVQALSRFGWAEGKNVQIDYRFAAGMRTSFPAIGSAVA